MRAPIPGRCTLRGEKAWIGNGSWAGVVSLLAKQYDREGKQLGFTGCLVRSGTPGYQIGPEFLTMGLRAAVQNHLSFHDVEVPAAEILGEPQKGFMVMHKTWIETAPGCWSGRTSRPSSSRFARPRLGHEGRALPEPRRSAALPLARARRDRRSSASDGRISSAEFEAFHELLAREIDAHGKAPVWVVALVHAYHRALDTGGDGATDEAEYTTYLRAIGARVDPAAAFRRLEIDELEELYIQFLISDDPRDPGNSLVTGSLG